MRVHTLNFIFRCLISIIPEEFIKRNLADDNKYFVKNIIYFYIYFLSYFEDILVDTLNFTLHTVCLIAIQIYKLNIILQF